MTIKVDKEAILQLVRPAARILMGSDKSNYISKRSQEVFLSKSSSSAVPIEFGDDGALLPHSAIDSTISYPEILPPDLTDTDDDCESMSSGSTDSCHSDTSSKASKRVSFAWPIVTEVRSRPLTLPEDVATLFYSAEETQRYVIYSCLYCYMWSDLDSFLFFIVCVIFFSSSSIFISYKKHKPLVSDINIV